MFNAEIAAASAGNLFFFEVGQWYDYLMLVVVTAALAIVARLAIQSKWVALAVFIFIPVSLTLFWWPWSTQGTQSAGWFPIVKQYSALLGSLSLVALQYFPKLRSKYWYLSLPPLILAVNILEAVIRDFQCYGIHGHDQGIWVMGGPWNIMNGIAGILNALAISGWVGIYISRQKDHAIIWGDLTIWWIIGYDLWNFAYVYNCLSDRAWYSGLALLLSCTIPAFMKLGRGAWIQYRAYTLTFWSAVVLTFPSFMHQSVFAHHTSQNPAALFVLSLVALLFNIGVFIYHLLRIVKTKRNPFTQQVYADTKQSKALDAEHATPQVQAQIAARDY